jgi:anti-sigma regulatory factor (Ser/Thr protein kinase)
VVDDGVGIDPEIARREQTMTPPTGLQEGSLGLVLIRSLFPDTEIGAGRTGRGTTVRFSLSLDPVPSGR